MKHIKKLLVGIIVMLVSMVAFASDVNFGKNEYMENCAVCHGVDGKGAGPYTEMLKVDVMPDLTMLQKKNNGVFPFDHVRTVIDGRGEVKSHGPRDMPIWGNEYNAKAPSPDYFMAGEIDTEPFVSGRILMLVDYLQSIQQK